MTSKMDEVLRVGLIGYGLGGEAFHAPFISSTPGLRLAAIATSNPERADRARRRHPSARIAASADEIFGRGDEIDLAVIASPNRTHVPLALDALGAGLHVVVDKPLAPTPEEALRLIGEARRRKRLLTAYHNRRWDGDFLTVRRLLAEGALGDVLRFESRFDRWRPAMKPGWREAQAAEEAGGLLYDLGTHLIDQALVLFGPVTSVYAELDRRRPGVAVDDDVFVAMTHRSGVRSHLWASAAAAQLGFRFRVLGTRAAYAKLGFDPQEAALRAGHEPGAAGFGVEPQVDWGLAGAGGEVRAVEAERGDYGRFYRELVQAIRDGLPVPVDPRDAVAGLRIIAGARQSHETRQVVQVRGEDAAA